jgi:SAM-dependent methyltransferase
MCTARQKLERTDIYNSDDLFQNKLHLQRYEFTLKNITSDQSVLEVGTGLGVLSGMLTKHAAHYAGVEIDSEACQQARLRVGEPELIKQADAQELPFEDSSFNVVVCLEVLEHLRDYRRALSEMRRVLKPTGKLIASIPYRKRGGSGDTNPFYGPNPFHLYEPGEGEFLDALASNFFKVTFLYQIFKESAFLNLVRRLRLRRLLGLVEPYRQLTSGHPAALDQVAIEERKSGLVLALLAIAESPRD